jgi:cyclopropane fatty-acyl-phospholipid synthase-like methyltransferase
MDPKRFSAIAHGGLLIWNPAGPAKIDRALSDLAFTEESRCLDVGCGRAEVLVRLAERFGVHGTGIDSSTFAVDLARTEASRRARPGLVEITCGRFEDVSLPEDHYDLAICLGATHAIGGYDKTLSILGKLTRPGGHLLVGESYWRRAPDPEYLKEIEGTADDLQTHQGNLSTAAAAGLDVINASPCSVDDWDRYEGSYAENVERFVTENPDDPDVQAMIARIRPWREAYLRWGRDTLGFGLYLLRRPVGWAR